MARACGGRGDPGYFRALADNATATIGWLQAHGVEFVTPLYYLSAGPARIQPVGGGGAIVAKLLAAARRAGVKFVYDAPVSRLVMAAGERLSGVEARSRDGVAMLDADAVILACGGFQGNPAMMRAHFGPGAEIIKLISAGTRFDTGDGIRVATEHGAHGYWNVPLQLHASFLAAGPGIAHEKLTSINSWQIAARVAAALGIDPPRNAAR